MGRGIKIANRYSDKYPQYSECPKSVIAAVAFSLAMRMCEDNEIEATAMIREEWDALAENEIVPQKRPVPHKDRPW